MYATLHLDSLDLWILPDDPDTKGYSLDTDEGGNSVEVATTLLAKAGPDNVIPAMGKHHERFGQGVQFSALIHNLNKHILNRDL